MNRWVLRVAVLTLAGCRARTPTANTEAPASPPLRVVAPGPAVSPPAGATVQWTTRSANGSVLATQWTQGAVCTVEVEVDRQQYWTSHACFTTPEDLPFVSNDGERFLVVRMFPKLDEPLLEVTGVQVYRREAAEWDIPVGALLADAQRVRRSKAHFWWLAGVLGEKGAPPHLAPDGTGVELETIDGRHQLIPFQWPELTDEQKESISKIRAPKRDAITRKERADEARRDEEKRRQLAPPPTGYFVWEDASGVHYVSSLGEVPEAFRNQARRSTGQDVGAISDFNPPTCQPGNPNGCMPMFRMVLTRDAMGGHLSTPEYVGNVERPPNRPPP